jgi:hypothetical protein
MTMPRVSTIGRRFCAAFGLALLSVTMLAWTAPAGLAQDSEELKQVQLTEKHIEGFIAAQKDMAPLSSKLLEGGDKPDDALLAELETIAKKNGFQSFMEMEIVGANIAIVLDGLDPKTGEYTDPIEKMKLEMENIRQDTALSEKDRELVIEDLKQEIAAAKPLQYKENIDLVKKYQGELEKHAFGDMGESAPPAEAPAQPSQN